MQRKVIKTTKWVAHLGEFYHTVTVSSVEIKIVNLSTCLVIVVPPPRLRRAYQHILVPKSWNSEFHCMFWSWDCLGNLSTGDSVGLSCKNQKKCLDMSNILTFIQNGAEMSQYWVSNNDIKYWSLRRMSQWKKRSVVPYGGYVCRPYQRHNCHRFTSHIQQHPANQR